MISVNINGVELSLTPREATEFKCLAYLVAQGHIAHSQMRADVAMRSAATERALTRCKAAVRACGLSDEIKFL